MSQLSRHVSRDCHECPGVTGDLYLVSIGSLMVRDGLDTPGDCCMSYVTSHRKRTETIFIYISKDRCLLANLDILKPANNLV